MQLGIAELCAKFLQIMRTDLGDYAPIFCQLCANYAHHFITSVLFFLVFKNKELLN